MFAVKEREKKDFPAERYEMISNPISHNLAYYKACSILFTRE